MSDENNEKRCIAHQIIFDLHAAKELGQIQLLFMACCLSYKSLDPEAYGKALTGDPNVYGLKMALEGWFGMDPDAPPHEWSKAEREVRQACYKLWTDFRKDKPITTHTAPEKEGE